MCHVTRLFPNPNPFTGFLNGVHLNVLFLKLNTLLMAQIQSGHVLFLIPGAHCLLLNSSQTSLLKTSKVDLHTIYLYINAKHTQRPERYTHMRLLNISFQKPLFCCYNFTHPV